MTKEETAAAKAALTLIQGEEEAEETAEATEQGAEEAAQAGAEEEEDFPNFEVEVPQELLDELEEEDFDESSVVRDLEQTEEYHTLDDEGKRLLARALAAERKAEHFENLRKKEAQKGWHEEAKKFFPLSEPFLTEIDASSRKGFMREAKKRHEAVLPIVKPLIERQKKEAKEAAETARAEAKEQAKKDWGSSGGQTPSETEAILTNEELARNRSKGDLVGTIRSMLIAGGSKNG